MDFVTQRFSSINGQIQTVFFHLKLLVAALMRELNEGGLQLHAKSLVYTSLLSLAPFLAVSFSILKGFGVHNQVEPLLLKLLEPLGEKGVEVTENIIGFVENIQVTVLGFIGFAMLFYTAVSLLEQIEACFNHIWRVAKPRSLYRRFSDYLSMILIGPVLLFSAIGITASMSSSDLVQRLIALEPFGTLYYVLGILLPYILISLAFSLAYAFMPNTHVKWGAALIGGLFAGVAWKITGALFAKFIADSAQYSAIYSGFAVILVSMIWLYVSWLILLLGSVIVFHVQYPRYLSYAARRPHLSIQYQEALGILLMALIGKQHIYGGSFCTLKVLADRAGLPWEPVVEILQILTEHGFLTTVGEEGGSYVLAHDSDSIMLEDILTVIRVHGDNPDRSLAQMETGNVKAGFLAELALYPKRAMHGRALRDIIPPNP
ncbi:YhjD/YihY/BrkB family envelope integrity protein [Methylomonas sp. MgM2]